MCKRLTEAANAAVVEAQAARLRADKVAAELVKLRVRADRRAGEAHRAAVDVLRALHGAPPLVVLPHIAPTPPAAPAPAGRFALLELE